MNMVHRGLPEAKHTPDRVDPNADPEAMWKALRAAANDLPEGMTVGQMRDEMLTKPRRES